MKHHKIKASHHTYHKDGSITSHFEHEDGPHKDVHTAHADHDSMIDHIMDHTAPPDAAAAPAAGAPAAAPGMPGAAPAGPVA